MRTGKLLATTDERLHEVSYVVYSLLFSHYVSALDMLPSAIPHTDRFALHLSELQHG
jgi:hypothetical protein